MPFSEARFWTHVGFILLIKIAVLFILWYAFFVPGHHVNPDSITVQHHLTGSI